MFKKNNYAGFSLVQVLIAAGLISAGMLVLMRQIELQTKSQRSMYEHLDAQSFTQTITLHMKKLDQCSETLKNLDPTVPLGINVSDIKNDDGSVRFTTGGKTGGGSKHGRLYLDSMKILTSGIISPSRLVDINLIITMEKSGQGYGDEVSQIIPIQVLLKPAPSNDILGCNDPTSPIPKGAIMAFNLATCPIGWSSADGTGGNPDLRGYFIRGLDTGGLVDPGRALGSLQQDSLQKHSHIVKNLYKNRCNSTDNGTDDANGFCRKSRIVWYDKTTNKNDIINANVDTETRPKNVAFLYCIKN